MRYQRAIEGRLNNLNDFRPRQFARRGDLRAFCGFVPNVARTVLIDGIRNVVVVACLAARKILHRRWR